MRFPAQFEEFFPSLAKCLAVLAALLFAVAICPAQTKLAPKQAAAPTEKNDESGEAMHLLAAMGKLNEKFQDQVKLPSPRTESHLLSLLPPSTAAFAAFAD